MAQRQRGQLAQLLLLIYPWIIQPGLSYNVPTDKIIRQPGNELMDYQAYRHITVMHFVVPENAVFVNFKFKAKEEKTGGLGQCEPRNVTIHLKSGSIPLVTPDNSKIGAKLLTPRRMHRTVSTLSDSNEIFIPLRGPTPGDWYVVAYRAWIDPYSSKIKQQGIGPSCVTVLDSELSIEKPSSFHQLDGLYDKEEGFTTRVNSTSTTSLMRFHAPSANARSASLLVNSSCENCTMKLHLYSSEPLLDRSLHGSQLYRFDFRPRDEDFHMLALYLIGGNGSDVQVRLRLKPQLTSGALNSSDDTDDDDDDILAANNVSEVRLVRKTLPDFFLFDYEHLVGQHSDQTAPFTIQAKGTSVMKFDVSSLSDTGGTLSLALKIVEAEKASSPDDVVVVGCVSMGYPTPVSSTGNCLRDSGKPPSPSDIYVANRSSPDTVHVPYPEPGTWYLTTRAFRLEPDCACFEECSRNGSTTTASPICESCHCARPSVAKVHGNVSSSPCVEGGCGPRGTCHKYSSGGIVFSACQCHGGYRGFDCVDDEYMLSASEALRNLLVLTLSNFAFVPTIVVAIRRYYYTESLVYTAVLFFSSFYHACETNPEGHSFCPMSLNVLQFCDFFNALASIWVTLIAMASMGSRATSFCHMLGVIILAFGAEMDRTALWVFLLPAVTGCLIVISSWAYKCRQKGTFEYPARTYRLVFLPIGFTTVVAGLICYAFLQTNRNYWILHSLWHVCAAVGIIFLLPNREYME